MNRRTFLSALLASPVLIRAAFKNLPKAGDPIRIPLISIDPAFPKDHVKFWMVSTPNGPPSEVERIWMASFEENQLAKHRRSPHRMWAIDWEDITWGPAPAYDPKKPEFSS